MIDIDALVALMRERAQTPAGRAAGAAVDRSADDGRPKHAAWITFRSAGADGQVTVWDSGEAETVIGLGDEVRQAHHRDLTLPPVAALVDETLAMIGDA